MSRQVSMLKLMFVELAAISAACLFHFLILAQAGKLAEFGFVAGSIWAGLMGIWAVNVYRIYSGQEWNTRLIAALVLMSMADFALAVGLLFICENYSPATQLSFFYAKNLVVHGILFPIFAVRYLAIPTSKDP